MRRSRTATGTETTARLRRNQKSHRRGAENAEVRLETFLSVLVRLSYGLHDSRKPKTNRLILCPDFTRTRPPECSPDRTAHHSRPAQQGRRIALRQPHEFSATSVPLWPSGCGRKVRWTKFESVNGVRDSDSWRLVRELDLRDFLRAVVAGREHELDGGNPAHSRFERNDLSQRYAIGKGRDRPLRRIKCAEAHARIQR